MRQYLLQMAVSSQNSRWWSNTNSNFRIKTRDHYLFKANALCVIFKNRLIGPHFSRQSMNAGRNLQFLQN